MCRQKQTNTVSDITRSLLIKVLNKHVFLTPTVVKQPPSELSHVPEEQLLCFYHTAAELSELLWRSLTFQFFLFCCCLLSPQNGSCSSDDTNACNL